MEISEISFVPHGDVGASEMCVVEQHKALVNNNQYDDAVELLKNNNFDKGVMAYLLNSIVDKIYKLQYYLLNEYIAENDEYYSDSEPDADFMNDNGYKFWIKPW